MAILQINLHRRVYLDILIDADLVTFTEEILHGKLHFLCRTISNTSLQFMLSLFFNFCFIGHHHDFGGILLNCSVM